MKTSIIKLSEKDIDKDKKELKKITETFKEGGLVVFPTETVYGLGANGLDKEAVKKIYEAKGRPNDNPSILHIAKTSQLDELVSEIPKIAKKCINNFWPGPLTIIFKKSDIFIILHKNKVSCLTLLSFILLFSTVFFVKSFYLTTTFSSSLFTRVEWVTIVANFYFDFFFC